MSTNHLEPNTGIPAPIPRTLASTLCLKGYGNGTEDWTGFDTQTGSYNSVRPYKL